MGCFKASKLPKFPLSFPKSFIVNIYEREKIGHFVAILLRKDYVIYFDPLAEEPWCKKIVQYLKEYYMHVKVYYCLFPVQDDFSVKCAHFCSMFILHVKNLKSFQSYLRMFHKRKLWKNDKIINYCLSYY